MALTTNLVSYWKFDEASGNATDTVGANTLTNFGTATFGSAKINNGVTLNGTTQYMNITDAAQSGLGITGDLTMAGWINFSTFNSASIYVIGGKATLDAVTVRSWQIQMNVTGANKLDFEISNGTLDPRSGVAWTPSTATWYYLTFVYTAAAGTVDSYINAVAQTQQTGYPTSINVSTAPFTMGSALQSGAQTFFLPASLDEWGVWSRGLTGSEITQLYNGGAGLAYPFAVASSNFSNNLLLMGV